MSLKSSLQELDRIDIEIKRLNDNLKQLRKQKKNVEQNIIGFLNAKNQPGVKYKNNAIIVEKKEKRIRKKKNQKQEEIMNILVSYGVHNPNEAFNKIVEANSGNVEITDKLKIQKIS